MKKEKEHLKLILINFFIMYIPWFFLFFIMLNFKYNYRFNNWIYISLVAFFFNLPITIVMWHRTQYKILKIPDNSIKDIDKINKFISSNKVKILTSSIDTKIYKIKHRSSFIPLKFAISKKESNHLIILPRIIIHEFLDNLDALDDLDDFEIF